jgi:alkaline phosphatase D
MNRRGLLALTLGGVAPAFVRHVNAAEVDRFALGVASGYPRPDGVVLWTRLTGGPLPETVPVRWEIAHDEAFTRIAAQGQAEATARWAHSLHVEPRGLAPGRWYWYRFSALGQRSRVGRTRTAPARAEAAPLRFMTASCQRWDHGHWAAWRDATEQPLDLVLFLGDYIYESPYQPGKVREHSGGECRTLADYRARYTQYKSDPALQAAHAAAPWVLVWDDHEVDNDYAGLVDQGRSRHFAARRAAAYQACWEHQPMPMAWRPQGPDMRIYGHLDWGRDVRIVCLDDRQYRDPQACQRPAIGGGTTVRRGDCPALADPARTLLGSAQDTWLRRQALRDDARWHLIAQQTLMAPLHAGDAARPDDQVVWTDGWDGYPAARARLLDTMAERRAAGCVVLGGDVHASVVADLHHNPANADTPVVASEFCGTSISSQGMPQERLDGLAACHPHVHLARSRERGSLHFSLDHDHLQATLRTVDRPLDADSPVRAYASFAVAAQRPGIVPG